MTSKKDKTKPSHRNRTDSQLPEVGVEGWECGGKQNG